MISTLNWHPGTENPEHSNPVIVQVRHTNYDRQVTNYYDIATYNNHGWESDCEQQSIGGRLEHKNRSTGEISFMSTEVVRWAELPTFEV